METLLLVPQNGSFGNPAQDMRQDYQQVKKASKQSVLNIIAMWIQRVNWHLGMGFIYDMVFGTIRHLLI